MQLALLASNMITPIAYNLDQSQSVIDYGQ